MVREFWLFIYGVFLYRLYRSISALNMSMPCPARNLITADMYGTSERSREMVQSDGAPQCFLQPESVDETSHPEPAMSRSLTASCRTSEGGSIVLSERDVLIRSTCTINIMLILKLPPKAC